MDEYQTQPEQEVAKKAVRERDNYLCVDCGKAKPSDDSRELSVHRIWPRGIYSLSNCVTLCQSCHMRRHLRSRAAGTKRHETSPELAGVGQIELNKLAEKLKKREKQPA